MSNLARRMRLLLVLVLLLACIHLSRTFRVRPSTRRINTTNRASIIDTEENELNTQSSSFDEPPSSVPGMVPPINQKTQDFVQAFFSTQQEDPLSSMINYNKENGELLQKLRSKGSVLLDNLRNEKKLPFGKQEAWRHANLRKVFPSLSYSLPKSGVHHDLNAIKTQIDKYVHDECKDKSVIVLIDGVYCSDLSSLSALQDEQGMSIHTLSHDLLNNNNNNDNNDKVLKSMTSYVTNDANIMDATELDRDSMGSTGLTAMSLTHCQDVVSLNVHSEQQIKTPIHIINYNNPNMDMTGKGKCVFPRVHIDIAQGSSLKVKQSFIGASSPDSVTESGIVAATEPVNSNIIISNTVMRIATNGALYHTLEQDLPLSSRYLEVMQVDMDGTESMLDTAQLQSGGIYTRVNAHINILHSSSNCTISSVALPEKRQTHDLHSSIVHACPASLSRQQHRNVVGESGESIFKGRIRIPQIAQETDSEQLCRSLMLGEKARIIAMPTLEITADNVCCSHGASVQDLDENSIFYLAARGIDRREARKLLLRSFSLDVLQHSMMDEQACARVITKTDRMTPKGQSVDRGQHLESM